MFSLNKLSTRNDNESKQEANSKPRRKSLTNYIRQSLQIAATPPAAPMQPTYRPLTSEHSHILNNFDKDTLATVTTYDKLRNGHETASSTVKSNNYQNGHMFEPDPDYWDLPYNNNLNIMRPKG